jgi:hypothetical protein
MGLARPLLLRMGIVVNEAVDTVGDTVLEDFLPHLAFREGRPRLRDSFATRGTRVSQETTDDD